MSSIIKEKVIEMVCDYIDKNEVYHKYKREMAIEGVFLYGYYSENIKLQVEIKFKLVGRGRKPNRARFDLIVNLTEDKEKIVFQYEYFKEKK